MPPWRPFAQGRRRRTTGLRPTDAEKAPISTDPPNASRLDERTVGGTGPAVPLIGCHSRTAHKGGRWLFPLSANLGITGLGTTVPEARERAYATVRRIRFEGAHWRTEIAAEATDDRSAGPG
jgi:hypothetical protein